MKMIQKKDVMTILDIKKAKKYIGSDGYFANRYDKNPVNWIFGTLGMTGDKNFDVDCAFFARNSHGNFDWYGLFVPKNKGYKAKTKL